MTLGFMRTNGACDVPELPTPGYPVPAFGQGMVCTRCGVPPTSQLQRFTSATIDALSSPPTHSNLFQVA
jgi:hypothetical protein